MNGFYYLATPYSRYPCGQEAAYFEASRAAAHLMKRGVIVFCPIAHSHSLAVLGGIDPANHDIWIPADQPFMDHAKGLIVAKMLTWQTSHGVRVEIDTFEAAGKPIYYMDWPSGVFTGEAPTEWKDGE